MIALSNGELEATSGATITVMGPGADLLQLSGNGTGTSANTSQGNRIFHVDAGSTLFVSGITMTNGSGGSYSGGDILNYGTLTVSDSSLINSYTIAYGGGVYGQGASTTLNRVTLLGNGASFGGAVYFYGGTAKLTDCTLSANYGISEGGFVGTMGAAITLNNSTVAGNRAMQAGGAALFDGSTMVSTDSIIAGNTSYSSYSDLYASSGGYTDNGGNLISTAAASTIAPNLSAPGYNGGHVMTMIPLPASPAYCSGVQAGTMNSSGYVLPAYDERGPGFPRTTTYGSTTCVDAGAAQSSPGLQFSTQPSTSAINAPIIGPPAVEYLDHGAPVSGGVVMIPLALNGNGVLSNGTSNTSATTGIATYSTATISAAGSGDTLKASLTISSTVILTATSQPFDVLVPTTLIYTTSPQTQIVAGGNPGTVVVEEVDGSSRYAPGIDPITLTIRGPNSNTIVSSATVTATAGIATFNLGNVPLTAAGTYTVVASSGTLASASATTLVVPGALTTLKVTGFPTPTAPSFPGTVTVSAFDAYNNLASNFGGVVYLTSSDANATLPSAYSYGGSDSGTHSFTVSFFTPGMQSIVATSGSVSGTQSGITVTQPVWVLNNTGSISKVVAASGVGSVLIQSTGGSNTASTAGGIVIDSAANAWSVSNGVNLVQEVSWTGTLLSGSNGFTGAGLNQPTSLIIDGAGDVWVANTNNSVSVLSPSGSALSPATGYQSSTFNAPSAVAVDRAGSVWIANKTGNTVTKLVGAATPVVTPVLNTTVNNTQGTKP